MRRLVYILLFIPTCLANAQERRSLAYYQEIARQQNPVLKQLSNSQNILQLQLELNNKQIRKPQIYYSNDLMFTPTFFEDGKPISFINSFRSDGFGYDAALSIRTLYAAQMNISKNILGWKSRKLYTNQFQISNRSVEQSKLQVIHDLEKTITDQYIDLYQTQLQIAYLNNVIRMTQDRIRMVESLTQQGLMSASDLLLLQITLKEHLNTMELFHIQLVNGFGQLHMTCNVQDTSVYEVIKPELSLSVPKKEFQFQQRYVNDSINSVNNRKLSELKYQPQLSTYATSGYYSSTLREIYRKLGVSGGMRFVIPIYDGQQRKNMASQYAIELKNLQVMNDYSKQQLNANLFYVRKQIDDTEKSIQLIDDKLKSQEQLLALLKDKMLLGQLSVIDYLVSLADYESTYQNKALAEASRLTLINQYNYLNW